MTPKNRAWLLLLVVAVICGSSVWGVVWYRSRPLSLPAMMKRLPTQGAPLLYIDFAGLRQAGILQLLDGSQASEDPEYLTFVRKTRFDYRQDLDSALVAFAPTGTYMLVKGRFDWNSLRAYAQTSGGTCAYSLCRVPGSSETHRISFLPLQDNLMAVAVSADETAATDVTTSASGPNPEPPSGLVWLKIPGSWLRLRPGLPDGTQMFAHSVEQADSITLSFAPESGHLSGRLVVRCASDHEAAEVSAQLILATARLREAILRENHVPNPADLSGPLSSGSFRSEGNRVLGNWTFEPAFIHNILGGGN
ncbi:MAG TPA: hypothetical protein VME43_04170 [Bryobacteraceae bacterium]|nr:hypothetical protein [Bryobacteraceae bacterium]